MLSDPPTETLDRIRQCIDGSITDVGVEVPQLKASASGATLIGRVFSESGGLDVVPPSLSGTVPVNRYGSRASMTHFCFHGWP